MNEDRLGDGREKGEILGGSSKTASCSHNQSRLARLQEASRRQVSLIGAIISGSLIFHFYKMLRIKKGKL
jgi:hypothetical protein